MTFKNSLALVIHKIHTVIEKMGKKIKISKNILIFHENIMTTCYIK